MRKLAREGAALPEISSIANSLRDGYGVDSLLRSFFTYRPEHREVVRTVPRMIFDLDSLGYVEGDCDDISTLSAAFLSSMGIRNRFVAIRYGGSSEFLHVFSEWFYSPSQEWVRMDVTIPFGIVHEEDERIVFDVL